MPGGEIFGEALWPGVQGFLSCVYTNSRGTTPGVATLVVPFQADPIPPEGTLTIRDGVNPPLVLPGCRVASAQVVEVDGGAKALALQILDRRWAWRYGRVYGWYNQQDDDPDQQALPAGEFQVRSGLFVPGTERTPRELVGLLGTALGETITVGDLPADARPPCDWLGANPAAALAAVADQLGAAVCYRPADGGRVLVTTRGGPTDALRDDWPVFEESPGLAVPAPPDGWVVVGGPVWLADRLPLEPVGPEADGRWLPIDDLSYKPEGGWGEYTPDVAWVQVKNKGTYSHIDHAKDAAREYVWKVYRLKLSEDKPYRFPKDGVPEVTARKQVRLADRVYSAEKDVRGQPISYDARVYGDAFPAAGSNLLRQKNHAPEDRLFEPFSVDASRGHVVFSRPVYKVLSKDPKWKIGPPDLKVYTSFQVRFPKSHQFLVFEHRSPGNRSVPGGDASGPAAPGDDPAACEVVSRPELAYTLLVPDTADRGAVADNYAEVQAAAEFHVAQAKKKYEYANTRTRTYGGVWPVDPGNAVEQVTVSVGGGRPAATTASVNCEHAVWLPPYPERRRNQRADFTLNQHDLKVTPS